VVRFSARTTVRPHALLVGDEAPPTVWRSPGRPAGCDQVRRSRIAL